VIRVVRGAEPEWYEHAVNANRGPERNLLWATAKQRMEHYNIHASETAWIGTDFDRVINNNGSLDELYQQVTGLVQDLRDAKADLAA
jgi:hypothetical protein